MTTTNKPNKAFWVIGVIALLWNLMGSFQLLLSTVLSDMAAEMFTAQELELSNSLPSWYNYVFGIAIVAGILGCLFLLLRKKLASPLLGISLIAVLIQMGYWMFATDLIEILGMEAVVMPMLVIIVSIFLYFYSKGAVLKGWLN